ncbi:MAG: helix-turn-helix domain-containing protein [Opitutaceae bacterium]|jgi:transcriptional regulator with XRE-family HTH domain
MARPHITDLRKLRKLSQAALAKAIGLTSSEISRIECGYRDLAEVEAVAIAKALDVVPGKIDVRLLKPLAPVGMAASTGAVAEPKPALPSGSLEDDPANFRELPNMTVLERVSLGEPDYRQRLIEALKRANQVLHTSRVPAATWRAWREFERMGQERLRGA